PMKNVFVFSFSILTSLNIALTGATNKTEKELFEGVGYNRGFLNSDDVYLFFTELLAEYEKFESKFYSRSLKIANRLLIHKKNHYEAKVEYRKKLLDFYKAEVNEASLLTEKMQLSKRVMNGLMK
ncbi:hypothetical protein B4U80_12044, partial [Leptotrombidium deliense]